MKRVHFISALLAGLCLAGCAHQSGHKLQKSSHHKAAASGPQPVATSSSGQNNLVVPLSNRRGDKDKLDGAKVFAKYNTAVFRVFTTDGHHEYQGSGFFINSSGLAVSNYHVFEGTYASAVKLANSDEWFEVNEICHSEEEDFIIFRVNVSNSNYIPVARYKPAVGEKVYAIGSPLGLENTFSSGEVSKWHDSNVMQISVPIDHGSSGGALINEYGEVVGITSGTLAANSNANINYAMSIDAIKSHVTCK